MDPNKNEQPGGQPPAPGAAPAPAAPPAPSLDDALKQIAVLNQRIQQQDMVIAAAAQRIATPAGTQPGDASPPNEEEVDPEIERAVQRRVDARLKELEPKLSSVRDMSDYNQYMQRWGAVLNEEQHKQVEAAYRGWLANGVREVAGVPISREDAVSFLFGEANKKTLLEQARGVSEAARRAMNAAAIVERGGAPINENLSANPDFDKLSRAERIAALEKRLDERGF